MEPRKEVLKKTPEQRQEERKSRFQIVKLEERIAPHKDCSPFSCCHDNPHGKLVGPC